MKKISLVTGANGHVGNNLVRELLKKGEQVRAGVRNLNDKAPFADLDCEVVYADLLDQESLQQALVGVDVLYQVAAVFKHWALDPVKEIITPNVQGTINILEAARAANVSRIVYVSSVAALSMNQVNAKGRIDETSWLEDSYGNGYFESKLLSEQKAWELARAYDLDLVSVLPGTVIGGHFFNKTLTLLGFDSLLYGKMKYNYITEMSPIDAVDVAQGMIAAAEKGIKGTRYILANEDPVTYDEMIELAQQINPDLIPPVKYSKAELLILADQLEAEAKASNTAPTLLKSQIELYYDGINRHYDTSTARRDLGFAPEPGLKVVENYFRRIYTPSIKNP